MCLFIFNLRKSAEIFTYTIHILVSLSPFLFLFCYLFGFFFFGLDASLRLGTQVSSKRLFLSEQLLPRGVEQEWPHFFTHFIIFPFQ